MKKNNTIIIVVIIIILALLVWYFMFADKNQVASGPAVREQNSAVSNNAVQIGNNQATTEDDANSEIEAVEPAPAPIELENIEANPDGSAPV